MKRLFIVLLIGWPGLSTVAQKNKTVNASTNKKVQVVEAACGQCKFGVTGKTCDLAIRMNGQVYFVDGTNIDSHGDAHAEDGFCQAIRKAEVRGIIAGSRFKASYFKLLPDSSNIQKVN